MVLILMNILSGKKGPIVIVQIEHILAIENLDKIFSLPEIDGFIVGPYDLSCSMNIPGQFNNKKYKDIISLILKTGIENNCTPGIHVVEPDLELLEENIKNNFKFIAYSVDIRMLSVTANRGYKTFKMNT